MFFAMFNRAWGGIVYYRRSLGHFKQNTVFKSLQIMGVKNV